MGIVRTVEWRMVAPAEDVDGLLRRALATLDMQPEGPPGRVSGGAGRSLLRNRWASSVTAEVQPEARGSTVVLSVEMAGSKHYDVVNDIAEAMGEAAFDDRGLNEALGRLHKVSKFAGRKELRHVRNLLRSNERVFGIAQGQYSKNQGIAVLTNERLFFFEKSLGANETLDEFPVGSISSLSVSKSLGGETLRVFASGHSEEIKGMMHGQADALARAFRDLQR